MGFYSPTIRANYSIAGQVVNHNFSGTCIAQLKKSSILFNLCWQYFYIKSYHFSIQYHLVFIDCFKAEALAVVGSCSPSHVFPWCASSRTSELLVSGINGWLHESDVYIDCFPGVFLLTYHLNSNPFLPMKITRKLNNTTLCCILWYC